MLPTGCQSPVLMPGPERRADDQRVHTEDDPEVHWAEDVAGDDRLQDGKYQEKQQDADTRDDVLHAVVMMVDVGDALMIH